MSHARVHGAGPTGCLAALALAQVGWQVHLCDPLDAPGLLGRQRAYALTHSSFALLDRLGLWQALEPQLVPFASLELWDQATGRQSHFTAADLGRGRRRQPGPFGAQDAAAADGARGPGSGASGTTGPRSGDRGEAVGWIVQHGPLMELLLHQLQAHPQVILQLGRPGPGAGSAPAAGPAADPVVDLVVGADGSQSPCRQAAGLAWFERTYGQACLTVQVRLRGGRPDQAWELLRPEGPFAVLPLGGDAFQLVWSAPARRLRRLESLDGAAFLDQLAGALPDQLQPEALLDQPRAYPVALALAWPLAKAPLVLVGDSAHRCHPVGGQGLNLGWRDVDCLQRLAARVSSGRLGPERLAAAYRWRRWPDLLATLLVTDLLVRLFSNRNRLLLPLRRLALDLLNGWPLLRRLSLAAMTDGPCQPGRR